eukprot:1775448-Rhodomonas_salina.1
MAYSLPPSLPPSLSHCVGLWAAGWATVTVWNKAEKQAALIAGLSLPPSLSLPLSSPSLSFLPPARRPSHTTHTHTPQIHHTLSHTLSLFLSLLLCGARLNSKLLSS